MKYVKKYIIWYSIKGNPHTYKYTSYRCFKAMCKQMLKNENKDIFDYCIPQIIIEWNSLQDLSSGILSGSITQDGQQQKESIRTMETANKPAKNSKQLTLKI